MLIARFPFKKIAKTDLGEIYRPLADVLVFSAKRKSWIPITMLVDSGADYTMLPKKYAEILGIDLNVDCRPSTTSGIGGSETVYFCRALNLKIDKWQKKVPVGFLERDDIPALLGRLGCLEDIEVIFKNRQTIFKQ